MIIRTLLLACVAIWVVDARIIIEVIQVVNGKRGCQDNCKPAVTAGPSPNLQTTTTPEETTTTTPEETTTTTPEETTTTTPEETTTTTPEETTTITPEETTTITPEETTTTILTTPPTTEPPINETAVQEEIEAEEANLNQTQEELNNLTNTIEQQEQEVSALNNTVNDLESEAQEAEAITDALAGLINAFDSFRRRLKRQTSPILKWDYCPAGTELNATTFEILKKVLADVSSGNFTGANLTCRITFIEMLAQGLTNKIFTISDEEKEAAKQEAIDEKAANEAKQKEIQDEIERAKAEFDQKQAETERLKNEKEELDAQISEQEETLAKLKEDLAKAKETKPTEKEKTTTPISITTTVKEKTSEPTITTPEETTTTTPEETITTTPEEITTTMVTVSPTPLMNTEGTLVTTAFPEIPVTFKPTGNKTNLSLQLSIGRNDTNFTATLDIDIDFTAVMETEDVNKQIIYIYVNSTLNNIDEDGSPVSENSTGSYGIRVNDTAIIVPFENSEHVQLEVEEFSFDPTTTNVSFILRGELIDLKEGVRITFVIEINVTGKDEDGKTVTAGVSDVTVEEETTVAP